MAKNVLTNVRLFAGGADLTGVSNQLDISCQVEEKDVTCWPTDDTTTIVWKEVLGGLYSTEISADGAWEAGDPGKVDDASWADLGGLGAWTACPRTAAVDSVAWLTYAMRGEYSLLGEVGDVAPWSAKATGSWPIVRGRILHPPGTARSTTGGGTSVHHIPTAAGQHLYAALHVLSVSGTATPTITVKIQSDDNPGFTSLTDRITFTAATAPGGQIQRVAGPITDDWFKAAWTISGTSPSFLFVVSLGVG